jgi:hypothetical protein
MRRAGMAPFSIVLTALSLAALSLVALTGCTAAPPKVRLSVSVFQYRSDYAPRQVQIEIHNHSSHDLTITSATFASAWFSTAVASKSTPSSVVARGTTDFPVVLAAAKCSVADPTPTVRIAYRTNAGIRGTSVTIPTVPFHSLATVHAQDCSRQSFESVATLTPASALRFEQVGGRPIALLDITVRPTGAAGSATIHRIQDTTLLAQREGDLRTFEQTFTAESPPTVITLDYTPTRCEQHIVAEDKVGTVIPFHVDAPGFSNAQFGLPVSAAVKTQILDWVGDYCGW